MRLSLPTLALMLLTIAGCSNAGSIADTSGSGNTDKSPATLRVVAEHEYVNHAWGYSHHGLVITSDRNVHAYEYPHGGTPWPQPEGVTVSAGQLDAKYAVGRRHLGQISADTLALIVQLTDGASTGTMSERNCMGADMGSHERMAYQYNASTKIYTKISLRINGDCDLHNTSPQAMQLADVIDAIVARFAK